MHVGFIKRKLVFLVEGRSLRSRLAGASSTTVGRKWPDKFTVRLCPPVTLPACCWSKIADRVRSVSHSYTNFSFRGRVLGVHRLRYWGLHPGAPGSSRVRSRYPLRFVVFEDPHASEEASTPLPLYLLAFLPHLSSHCASPVSRDVTATPPNTWCVTPPAIRSFVVTIYHDPTTNCWSVSSNCTRRTRPCNSVVRVQLEEGCSGRHSTVECVGNPVLVLRQPRLFPTRHRSFDCEAHVV